MSVLLPLLPGTLPPNACYASEQDRLVAFMNASHAELDGQAFYNFGPDKPSNDNNAYPWFRTTDGRWYFYSGGWIAPNPERSPYIRRIWVGSDGAALKTYDGGDSGTPSDRSGPMWEIDTLISGRMLLAAGTLQPSGTVVAIGDTGGFDEHTLTDAEVPATRINPLDSSNNPTADKTVQKSGDTFGFSAQNGDFSGSSSGGRMTDIQLAVAGGGDPHTNMPPYFVVAVIKPTSRLYYAIP